MKKLVYILVLLLIVLGLVIIFNKDYIMSEIFNISDVETSNKLEKNVYRIITDYEYPPVECICDYKKEFEINFNNNTVIYYKVNYDPVVSIYDPSTGETTPGKGIEETFISKKSLNKDEIVELNNLITDIIKNNSKYINSSSDRLYKLKYDNKTIEINDLDTINKLYNLLEK